MTSSSNPPQVAVEPTASSAALIAAFVAAFALNAAHLAAAIWFGGVTSTAQATLTGLVVLGMAGAWFASCVLSPIGKSPALLNWLMIGALGLGTMQLWPSSWLANSIAAGQAARRADLTSIASTESASESSARKPTPAQPASLDPYATRRDLSLLGSIAAVLMASTWVGRFRPAATLFVVLAAVGGASYATFGLIQQMTWNGKIFWSVPSPNSSFASIVNPNNGAGYLTLCVAASLGAAAWVFGRGRAYEEPPLNTLFSRWHEQFIYAVRREIADLNAIKLSALALLALTTAGVLCTLSRGGIVSLVAGALLTTAAVVVIRRSAAGLWGGIATLGLGIAVTAWVGMSENVRLELATLSEDDAAHGRLSLWQSVLPLSQEFAWLGSGLGTFRQIHRSELLNAEGSWYYHAENQYVEALIDGGWLGLSLLVAALGVGLWGVLRAIRDSHSPMGLGIAIAATFALTSQALHATFDFGLYLPSNAWLLAALVGLAVGAPREPKPRREHDSSRRRRRSTSRSSSHKSTTTESKLLESQHESDSEPDDHRHAESRSTTRRSSRSRSRSGKSRSSRSSQEVLPVATASRWSGVLTLAAATVVMAALSWGWVDSVRASRLDRVTGVLPKSFDDLPEIAAGQAGRTTLESWANSLRPRCEETNSVDAWLLLSEIYTAAFRNRWLDAIAPEGTSPEIKLGLIPTTDLLELHRVCHLAAGSAGEAAAQTVIDETEGRSELLAADQALRRARAASPLRPRTHLRLAQTSMVSEPLAAGKAHLAHALLLAPQKASFQYFAGLLDLHAGRPEATSRWRQAIELDAPNVTGRILRISLKVFPLETIIEQVVPTDPSLRFSVAKQTPQQSLMGKQLAAQLLDLAETDLRSRPRTAEESVLWARILVAQDQRETAVVAYDEAIDQQPYEKQWLYELTEALLAIGNLDRARNEIKRVIALDNDWSAALSLRDRIRNEANRRLLPSGGS